MTGSKALALQDFCRARNQQFTRFDYQGHGASSGDFAAGTIGLWLGDALAVLDAVTSGPQIVVGSSMGGWIALLMARRSEEHTSELQSLMRISYAVFCLKKKKSQEIKKHNPNRQ